MTITTTPIHALVDRMSWARRTTRLDIDSTTSINDGATPMIFSDITAKGHENVLFCHDKATGLKAIIAVHNTTLGNALGGMRRWHYANEEEMIAQDTYELLK